jgi:hypothetical protein
VSAALFVVALTAVSGQGGAAGTSAPWDARYQVSASPDGQDLRVEAELSGVTGGALTIDPASAPFVDSPMMRVWSGRWLPVVPAAHGTWRAELCRASACRLRYVFHLGAAARALNDPDSAAERGGAVVAPASTWLMRPARLPETGLRARLRATAPAPLVFVTGLPRVAGSSDSYAVTLLPDFSSPYAAVGRLDVQQLDAPGSDVQLAFAMPSLGPDQPRLRAWVTAAVRAVTAYFGRFPVDRALVLAIPQPAGLHGKAMGGGGATVLIQVASGVDLADPSVDWQAAHEMVHLAVPQMARAHLWLTEGLATYVEPLARALTGELRPEVVWRDLIVGLTKGLPAPGDRGLDRTHTWGRTYWGGALFAFLADLEIRKASKDEQSLATALRGILREGGDTRVFWSAERFMATADRALGRPILTPLYRRWATTPIAVDLPALWRALGVSLSADGHVTFDEAAPLAALRRSMIGPVTPKHP